MEYRLVTIISSFLFLAVDSVILFNTYRHRDGSSNQKRFQTFNIFTVLQQAFAMLNLMIVWKTPAVLQYFFFIGLFCTMSLCSMFWYLYLRDLITENSKLSIMRMAMLSLPIALLAVTCLVSPITHWVFYINADGEYRRGSLVFLQIAVPYFYAVLAIIMGIVSSRKGNKSRTEKMVRYFLVFAIPSVFCAIIQMCIVQGGFTAIGISMGLILMYLELYVEDAKENMRLKTVDIMNQRLSEVNQEQEAQLEEIKSLNVQLEEHQALLEASAAEQESQLDEINVLNQQLKEKQQYTDLLYHKLMKVQSCGIVAYKVPEHKMLVMNDMARKMYDLPIDYDLENDGLIKHVSKVRYDDPEITLARLHSIKNPGERYSFSYWIQHENGTEVHVHTTTQLIQMDNGDLVVISSMQDISEITELYKTTEQEKAANSAKTSFLFNMSHDIRTPMNAIIGYTNLIEKHLDEKEKCKDYIEKVKNSNNFLLSLINNVLEMARIESGKVTLDEKPCRPLSACEEVESVYSEMMSNKGIHFTQTADIKTQYVYADAVKVRQVFLNLVSNAYKYTNAGGEVTVAIEELPSDKIDHVLMRATISDTGIGMSADYLPVLFEEFSREQSVTDNKIEGTGLGMPIVKRLVDLMKGTIKVESELGKGTTFVVTLPFRVAEEPSDQDITTEEIDPERFTGKRILLAEDNDLNAEIAVEILGEAGFIVDRAEDGVVCCEKIFDAENNYYDLILMDIQMPNMNGYDATRTIRKMQDSAKANIPILAMTANAFEEDKREALRAGMNGHLAKPVNVGELMKALAGILG